MKPVISLVMPVYNAEMYLERALDSILNQTLEDWELILVDDGSKDNSGAICDQYANRCGKIKVYHQANGGCSAARQTGMKYVQGDYVLHIDSDDWLEKNALSEYYQTINRTKADIIYSNAYCNDKGIWHFMEVDTPEEMVRAILGQKMWGVLWNKMIKVDIAKKWGSVPANVSMWEDIAYILPCLLHCNTLAYLDKALYHYNIDNEDSMIHRVQSKNMTVEYCNAVNFFEDCLKEVKQKDKYIKELQRLQLHAIRDFIDDIRFKDYDKFIQTYPDATAHIWDFEDYPIRLKVCAWLIQHNLRAFVPFICKIDAVLRRLGITKQF